MPEMLQLPLFPDLAEDSDEVREALGAAAGSGRKLEIVGLGEAAVVELEPGVFAAEMDLKGLPMMGLFRLKLMSNGMFQPFASVFPDRMTIDELTQYFPVGYQTVRRLVAAGFIKGEAPTPDRILVSVASFFAHVRRTRIGSGQEKFWNEQRTRSYRDARLEVG